MLHLEPSLKFKTLPSIYLTITGGGTGIIPKLLDQGGASSYFVGAEVPYSYELSDNVFAWLNWQGKSKPKLVSKKFAEILSENSREQIQLYHKYENLLGIGVTASLMKNDGERAERINEAYACFDYNGKLYEYHWVLAKEIKVLTETFHLSRREQEDELVGKIYKTLVEILSE